MMRTDFHFLETVDSTQNFAKKKVSEFDPEALTVICAEEQTQGRGRFNRSWFSPKGCNLYITYCFQIPHLDYSPSPITLILALSICEILQKLGLNAQIKWPNDLYLKGKKLGGILAESEMIASGYQFFLGFGLNVNLKPEQLEGLDFKATSLLCESSRTWDIKVLQTSIETTFKRDLAIFLQKGFHPFHASFERLSLLSGKTICLKDADKTVSGTYAGISKDGALLLKIDEQAPKAFISGEIISWE